LSYPAEKYTFVDILRSAMTSGWNELAARENTPGVVTIGGFTTEAVKAGHLLDLLFVSKGQAPGVDDFAILDRVDDFAAAEGDWESSAASSRLPEAFKLHQNFPNPFNPRTEIRFELPQPRQVVVKIFNTLGEEIRTLVDEHFEAGYHQVQWDGTDRSGRAVGSGVYFYQLRAGDFTQAKKMSLIR